MTNPTEDTELTEQELENAMDTDDQPDEIEPDEDDIVED